jgi:hypothetical protein
VRSLQLVTDLGDGIGSRVWLRGTATCLALCYAAWSFAPGMEPLIGASPAPIAEENWHELQALTISPLAYGADTGRRMAPTDAVQPMLDAPDRPSVELTAMMGFGDSFTRVLERAGVASVEAAQVAAMVAGVSDPNAIKPGHRNGPDAGKPIEPCCAASARGARFPRASRPEAQHPPCGRPADFDRIAGVGGRVAFAHPGPRRHQPLPCGRAAGIPAKRSKRTFARSQARSTSAISTKTIVSTSCWSIAGRQAGERKRLAALRRVGA